MKIVLCKKWCFNGSVVSWLMAHVDITSDGDHFEEVGEV